MLKKITILIITCLFAMTSLTGCISYWNGHSYNESKQLVADALKEIYGEEFVVVDIGTGSGGSYYSPGYLTATCHPKDDDTLYFEAEYFEHGRGCEISDTYIQSIIRKLLKNAIDPVLAENFEYYASEIYIQGTIFDPRFKKTNEVTVELYSDVISGKSEHNYIVMWLILEENNIVNQEEMIEILSGFTEAFFDIRTSINVCYAPKEVIEECAELTSSIGHDPKDINKLVNSKYLLHVYSINRFGKTLTFVKSIDYEELRKEIE